MAPKRKQTSKDDKPQGAKPQGIDKPHNDKSRVANQPRRQQNNRAASTSMTAGDTTAGQAFQRYFTQNAGSGARESHNNPPKTMNAPVASRPKPKPKGPHWTHFIEDFREQWPIFLTQNKWNKRTATGELIEDARAGADAGANTGPNMDGATEGTDPRWEMREPREQSPESTPSSIADITTSARDQEPTIFDPFINFSWNG